MKKFIGSLEKFAQEDIFDRERTLSVAVFEMLKHFSREK